MREVVCGVTQIRCPKCDSPLVSHDAPLANETSLYKKFLFNVRCTKCQASGYIEQFWDKETL